MTILGQMKPRNARQANRSESSIHNKGKEGITSEKNTTIVIKYVRRDEKSDREVDDYQNILAESMAKLQNGGETGDLGNNS